MLPRKFLLLHWMRAAQLLLQLSLVMKRLIVLHPMLIVASAAAEQPGRAVAGSKELEELHCLQQKNV